MLRRKYFFLKGGPVVSDEGFEVFFRPRGNITYKDSKGTVTILAEFLDAANNLDRTVAYARHMYLGPGRGAKIDDEERVRLIVQRIADVAEFMGKRFEVKMTQLPGYP